MTTTITNTAALDMNDLAAILSPIASQGNYSDVSASGFTATGSGLFPPTFEVEGSFIFFPNTTPIIGGSITSISYSGIDGDHIITFSSGISYNSFIGDLGNNDALLDLLLSGWDKIDGSGGVDTLYGGALGDTIHGRGGKDFIHGDDGDDHLYGDGGSDHLFGGAGRDWFSGGTGLDFIDGGQDADIVDYSDATGSVVVQLDGSHWAKVKIDGTVVDKLRNVEGIQGGSHADTLTGDANSNSLSGGGGGDTLKGGAGMDGTQRRRRQRCPFRRRRPRQSRRRTGQRCSDRRQRPRSLHLLRPHRPQAQRRHHHRLQGRSRFYRVVQIRIRPRRAAL